MLQDLEAGPIKSVHFSKVPKERPEGSHTPGEDVFSAPDFVVGSRTGSIVAVRSGSFEEASSDVPAHRLLVQVQTVSDSSCITQQLAQLSSSLERLLESKVLHGSSSCMLPCWHGRHVLALLPVRVCESGTSVIS